MLMLIQYQKEISNKSLMHFYFRILFQIDVKLAWLFSKLFCSLIDWFRLEKGFTNAVYIFWPFWFLLPFSILRLFQHQRRNVTRFDCFLYIFTERKKSIKIIVWIYLSMFFLRFNNSNIAQTFKRLFCS